MTITTSTRSTNVVDYNVTSRSAVSQATNTMIDAQLINTQNVDESTNIVDSSSSPRQESNMDVSTKDQHQPDSIPNNSNGNKNQ